MRVFRSDSLMSKLFSSCNIFILLDSLPRSFYKIKLLYDSVTRKSKAKRILARIHRV